MDEAVHGTIRVSLSKVREAVAKELGRMRAGQNIRVSQTYDFECFRHYHEDGARCTTPHDQCPLPHRSERIWYDKIENLVPTVGLNAYLDATLKTGLAVPAWYVFLVNNAGFTTGYSAADTFATHGGWVEGQPYSNATRPAFTPGTISGGAVSNSGSKAVFNINADMTVRGGGLVDNPVKADSTGTLLGEGDFTGGVKIVGSGDTVNVMVTITMTSV